MNKKIVGILACTLMLILSSIPVFKSDFNVSAKPSPSDITAEGNIITDSSIKIKKLPQQLIDDSEKHTDNQDSLEDRMFEKINKILKIRGGQLESNVKEEYDFMKSDYNTDKLEFIMNNNKVCSLSGEYLLKGFVTDNSNSEPINEAHIFALWNGDRYSYDRTSTVSNNEGFYTVNIEFDLLGQIWGTIRVVIRANGYYSEIIEIEDILENAEPGEELWLNASLNPGAPPENSIFCGYITDIDTNEPIKNAEIDIQRWESGPGYTDWNYTQTDSSGYFCINVAPGEKDFFIHSDAHYYYELLGSISFNIDENEIFWTNITLLSRPSEKSEIIGEITNKLTGEPIENAILLLISFSHPLMFDVDWAITDSTGHYQINVPPGYPPYGLCFTDGYFENYVMFFKKIAEYETINKDISLGPYPQETSVVSGYITDIATSDPIANTEINLLWHDMEYINVYSNSTYTDSSGFYRFDVAAGEIEVFYNDNDNKYFDEDSGYFVIGDNEAVSVDLALTPHPSENSIVCGFVTDEITTNPIFDATVQHSWKDDEKRYYNSTQTDQSGFYCMDIAAGIFEWRAYAYRYFSFESGYYNFEIDEYETIWVNISLSPYPQEKSVINGVVTDSLNNEPIKYAFIEFRWNDNWYYGNYTLTDSSGYYSINVPAGDIELYYYYPGYDQGTVEQSIDDYQTYVIDISLESFEIQIIKPKRGLYINNTRILPFLLIPTTIVFGAIEIEVDGPDTMDAVLFFVDDELKYEDYYSWDPPYSWLWDEKTFGRYKVTAASPTNTMFWNIAYDEIMLWKFF